MPLKSPKFIPRKISQQGSKKVIHTLPTKSRRKPDIATEKLITELIKRLKMNKSSTVVAMKDHNCELFHDLFLKKRDKINNFLRSNIFNTSVREIKIKLKKEFANVNPQLLRKAIDILKLDVNHKLAVVSATVQFKVLTNDKLKKYDVNYKKDVCATLISPVADYVTVLEDYLRFFEELYK